MRGRRFLPVVVLVFIAVAVPAGVTAATPAPGPSSTATSPSPAPTVIITHPVGSPPASPVPSSSPSVIHSTPSTRPTSRPRSSPVPGVTPAATAASTPSGGAAPASSVTPGGTPALLFPGCQTGASCPAACPGGVRAPSADEIDYWLERMRSGVPDEDVLAELLGSTEYFAGTGATEAKFTDTLYRDVNGADPDDAARTRINDMLAAGASRTSVARALLNDDRYRTAFDHDARHRLFGTEPAAADVAADVAAMRNGASDEAILTYIASSPAYYQLVGGEAGWLKRAYVDLVHQPAGQTTALPLPGPAGTTTVPLRTRLVQVLLASEIYRTELLRGYYARFLTRGTCTKSAAAQRPLLGLAPPVAFGLAVGGVVLLAASVLLLGRRRLRRPGS